MILTQRDAALLTQVARLADLRRKHLDSPDLEKLLRHIIAAAYGEPAAASGNQPRQYVASEERGLWTVRKLARATRLSERTVRLDIGNKTLPAEKQGNTWLVDEHEATTYIARRRKN